MGDGILGDARIIHHLLEMLCEELIAHVMSPPFEGAWIGRHSVRKKEPLPSEFPALVGEFLFESVGQIDFAKPLLQVMSVLATNAFDLLAKILADHFGEDGDTIDLSFPGSHDDVTFVKADIFHP